MGNFWIEGTIGAIKALAFVCDILTYPVYLILQRPWEKKTLSRRVKVSTLVCFIKILCLYRVKSPLKVVFGSSGFEHCSEENLSMNE
jgi:long-chain acyl-CoA synthetase